MFLMRFYIFIFLLFLTACGGFLAFNKYMDLPNDNPIEEAIEKVIEEEVGVKIDLTFLESVLKKTTFM